MKTLLTLLAVSVGLAVGMSAQAADKTLMEKHQGMWPRAVDGFVTKNQCLKCHQSYEALAAKTDKYAVNPHYSHLGAVDCVECHQPDKANPELMCNSCHKFDMNKKK